MNEQSRYLSGEALYGDDLAPEHLRAWFEDGKDDYARQLAAKQERYRYPWHLFDQHYVFRHLPQRTFARALGLGSAHGHEFEPIAERIHAIDIVDPLETRSNGDISGVPVRRSMPRWDGRLAFDGDTFDLILTFSVLQYIANVSTVLRELHRCLKPGGVLFIRDATVSMGDWREPRGRLSPRQRGIPIALFRKMLRDANLQVLFERRCGFPLFLPRGRVVRRGHRDSRLLIALDDALSRLFAWNNAYHATHVVQHLRPTIVVYGLTKK